MQKVRGSSPRRSTNPRSDAAGLAKAGRRDSLTGTIPLLMVIVSDVRRRRSRLTGLLIWVAGA